jgi:hypothetical protein
MLVGLFLCGLTILSPMDSSAANPESVLRQSFLFGERPTSTLSADLEIHRDGDVKERSLEVMYERTDGTVKLLVKVTEPFFLNGMKFLSIRGADGTEESWLSTTREVRKLEDTGGTRAVFDSDFTAEDLTGFEFSQYRLRQRGTEQIDGHEARVIVARSSESDAALPRRVIWIDTEAGLVRRIDYYDADGTLVKRYLLDETMTVDGAQYPARVRMKRVDGSSETRLRIHSIELVDDIPDSKFDERLL